MHSCQPRIPPLESIPLYTRPLARRALAWSCDAELAVAGDDSVHVLVPEFPFVQDDLGFGATNDPRRADEDEGLSKHEGNTNYDDGGKNQLPAPQRPQFSRGRLRIPASYPPIDDRVNAELFDASESLLRKGKNRAADDDGVMRDNTSRAPEGDNNEDSEADTPEEESDGPSGMTQAAKKSASHDADSFRRPQGAGHGLISGGAGTMNHVVAVEWSPAGIGRNRRPVLSVLTASGVLAIYGDGPKKASGSFPLYASTGGQMRDLDSWIILWAVGERFVVPGQEAEQADYIQCFAWSHELEDGRALLAYMNDDKEIAILSVSSQWSVSTGNAGAEKESMMLHVREVARFTSRGPHPTLSPWDVNFAPCGTSYGLRWSPWVSGGSGLTSVLAFFDTNYVGFRAITIDEQSQRRTTVKITVANNDCDGMCLNLSTDAFIEWEENIWTEGDSKVCRGLIATPFHVKAFQVAVTGPARNGKSLPQDPSLCGTMYNQNHPEQEVHPTDPIIGMVIERQASPSLSTPLTYTFIRLSATPSNDDWYGTGTASGDKGQVHYRHSDSNMPRWATEIQQKLDKPALAGFEDEGAESDTGLNERDDGVAQDDEDDGPVEDEDAEDDIIADGDDDENAKGDLSSPKQMVYPHRFRLYGLVASPGRGTTAVLASMFSTQTPEHGGFSALHSTVHFAPRLQIQPNIGDPSAMSPSTNALTVNQAGHSTNKITVEARMWEWMYGGGADVPGITVPGASQDDQNSPLARLRHTFEELGGIGGCDVCDVPLEIKGAGGRVGVCPKGHSFDICGVSGAAIQEPGISRTCGVCGARSLKLDALVQLAPQHEDHIRATLSGAGCGRCGGRYVD